jgi:HEPN domain-containing protein
VTKQDAVDLWRKEAQEALIAAEAVHAKGIYWLSLFSCHLAVEKALKALYVEERDADPPPTHELLEVADGLNHQWDEGMISLFDSLADFAIESRYHDEKWREKQATKENSQYWLKQTKSLLSSLLP